MGNHRKSRENHRKSRENYGKSQEITWKSQEIIGNHGTSRETMGRHLGGGLIRTWSTQVAFLMFLIFFGWLIFLWRG
jgi:hypothetical protein